MGVGPLPLVPGFGLVGVGVLGGFTVGGGDDGERGRDTVGGAVDWEGEGDEGGDVWV